MTMQFPSNMTNDLLQLVERWRIAARHAVELEGEADTAEAKRKAIKAELVNHGEGSMAARESMAEGHPRYHEAIADARAARTRANLQDVEAKALMMAFEAQRTMSANERAERRMVMG